MAALGPPTQVAPSGLGVALVLDAEPCRWNRLEPLVADVATASLAAAVGAVVQPPQRPLDVVELALDAVEDRELLLALEGIARCIGRMLVEVGQLGRRILLGLVVEVLVLDRGPQMGQPFMLRLQVTTC
jgi:hypothetical protein